MEKCYLEYLGKGERVVDGVGTFGAKRIDREAMLEYHKAGAAAQLDKKPPPRLPRRVRITKLPCSQSIARQFVKDKRFKVIGLAPLALPASEVTPSKKGKKKATGADSKKQNVQEKEVNDAR